MTYAATKKELRDAIRRKDEEIIVSGKLAKKLKGFVKRKKRSKKEQAALIAFVTGAGSAAGMILAAAVPTGGMSILFAAGRLLAEAPAAGISLGGVSMETVTFLVALLGAIGLTAIALLKDYDVEVAVRDTFRFRAKKPAGNV